MTSTTQMDLMTRFLCMPSCLPSFVPLFCIGLLSGAIGGLLLGRTAVVTLRSLELLADNNTQLMDHLESFIKHKYEVLSFAREIPISQRASCDRMFNVYISALAERFGFLCLTLSLAVGVKGGLWTFAFVNKRYEEPVALKAFSLAGPVCLMLVTATGYSLGFALERFLIIDFISLFGLFSAFFSVFGSLTYALFSVFIYFDLSCCFLCKPEFFLVILWFFYPTPTFVYIVFNIHFFLFSKLLLVVSVIETILLLNSHRCFDHFQLSSAGVPLMLIITDVFNIAQQPIVSPQLATETSSAVVEGLFIGALSSQMLMAAIGMSLFVSWQRGGAGKICAGAAALGAAVVAVIESALGVMGPGPTIGAVMGVAGAAGVSLSAAGAAADGYGEVVGGCGWVGRLGVTVGAGVGAFLSSCTNRGILWVFIGLCGASVPTGFYYKSLYLFLQRQVLTYKLLFCVPLAILLLVWYYFITLANVFFGLLSIYYIFVLLGFCMFWGLLLGKTATDPDYINV